MGGRHAARQILRRVRGEEAGQPFVYRDKGSMAVIGKAKAVASGGGMGGGIQAPVSGPGGSQ